MPNNIVFNNVASQLKSLIHGQDVNGNVLPLSLDTDGNMSIRQLTASDIITVQGITDTINIRNLTNSDVVTVQSITDTVNIRSLTASDIVMVQGITDTVNIRSLTASDIVTVQSISDTVNIRSLSGTTDSVSEILIGRRFTETNIMLSAVTGSDAVLTIDTSEYSMYSYYANNLGISTVTLVIQVSPTDNVDYFVNDEVATVTLAPGSKTVLVPSRYLRYTRVLYDVGTDTTTMDIWFDGQV
ncbi:MAG: DUF6385 domain-containing protein [Thermoanaerobacteraceae bacterium]|nr:DUF6385 domain-containing protein [Thermoanaerobacteraceae bacterium]